MKYLAVCNWNHTLEHILNYLKLTQWAKATQGAGLSKLNVESLLLHLRDSDFGILLDNFLNNLC